RIDLGALRRNGADQLAVISVGIKLQADAVSAEIEPRQHLDDALGGRLLRRRLRLQPDLAQRPAGLGPAGQFSGLAERSDQILRYLDTPSDLEQAAQAFAGQQHEVVAWLFDESPDPGLDWRGIGCVV